MVIIVNGKKYSTNKVVIYPDREDLDLEKVIVDSKGINIETPDVSDSVSFETLLYV